MTVNSLTLEVTGHGFTFRCWYAAVTEPPRFKGEDIDPHFPLGESIYLVTVL